MRAFVVFALVLAGCLGAAEPGAVRATNLTDGPASITVVVTDTTTHAVAFSHAFQVVQPGQTLEVAHDFARARSYVVNATALWQEAGMPQEVAGEQRVDIPRGGQIEVRLMERGALDIRTLVAE